MGEQQILFKYWRHYDGKRLCLGAEFTSPFDRPDSCYGREMTYRFPRWCRRGKTRLRLDGHALAINRLSPQERMLVRSLLADWQRDETFPLLEMEWQEPVPPGSCPNTVHRIVCRFGLRDREVRLLPMLKAIGYRFERAFDATTHLPGDPPRPLMEVLDL